MPEADCEERHHNMNEYVQRFTLQYWSDDFSTELDAFVGSKILSDGR